MKWEEIWESINTINMKKVSLREYSEFPILKEYMELEFHSKGSSDFSDPDVKKRLEFYDLYESDIFSQGRKFNLIIKERMKIGGDKGIHNPK